MCTAHVPYSSERRTTITDEPSLVSVSDAASVGTVSNRGDKRRSSAKGALDHLPMQTLHNGHACGTRAVLSGRVNGVAIVAYVWKL